MEMTVIYDEVGHIFYCAGGNIVEPVGLPFVKVIIPDGKILKSNIKEFYYVKYYQINYFNCKRNNFDNIPRINLSGYCGYK